ncbi:MULTISPECIES: hypothetical protein [unclassified Streptomyces]|uniref:hypothetical protein n=1 Tax=unclassified Streptomyces TaxID=2593676 RepID=UPI0035DB09FA
MPYTATLQFRPGGGVVTGTWATDERPRQVYREWVGLYALPGSTVAIKLVEETPDGERLIDQWPPPGDMPPSSDVTAPHTPR